MTRVLVVEDEESFSDALSYMLRREGFEAVVAATGPEALAEFDRGGADIVLLDLMLPGLSGTEVCRALRQRGSVPVIMLTARDSEIDKVVGLELGADDYLTKPFSMRELQARIAAILRRIELIKAQSQPRTVVERLDFPDLSIDVAGHGVRSQGQPVQLTATEFALLHLLASNPGRVFSREFLLEEVWGDDVAVFDRTIDSHIQRLRKKLGGTDSPGDLIETVWGVGYRFAARRSP